MSRWVVVLVLLTSCIEPELLLCGEDECPAGLVCQASGRCVSSEQLALCAGLADEADCVIGENAGKCFQGACTPVSCGNGILEPGEVCDDGNRTSGDGCSFDCLSNETCGNGYVDFVVGEQCDDGNTVGNDACEANCKLPRCGDGIVNMSVGEVCDDGNRVDGDGCSRDCLSNETCGNGIRDPGEECDDGNLVDHDGCQSNCKVQRCGDGVVDPGEDCDDGNFDNTDSCLNTCKLPTCGDGFTWVGHEQCDDGNADNTDECLDTCLLATCGDGYVWGGHEACDDPNLIASGCCHADCTLPRCGDGVAECTERCDASDGTCQNNCTTYCPPGGAGIVLNNIGGIISATAGDPANEVLYGSDHYGGDAYGGTVLDLSNNLKILIFGNDITDASTSPDLTVLGDSGFELGWSGDLQAGIWSDDVSLCSVDGEGTWNPAVTITVTDHCGTVVSATITSDPVESSTWPVCP